MNFIKWLFPASLIDCLRLHEKRKEMKVHLVSSFTVLVSLLLMLPTAVILHNLFFAVFGFEDAVFFFLGASLVFFLPIYLVYFLIVAISYLIARHKHRKNLCWKL